MVRLEKLSLMLQLGLEESSAKRSPRWPFQKTVAYSVSSRLLLFRHVPGKMALPINQDNHQRRNNHNLISLVARLYGITICCGCLSRNPFLRAAGPGAVLQATVCRR